MQELEPGAMIGEYRIVGKLGQGGMATVYSAIHPIIEKRAAIKIVSSLLSKESAALARFIQEARAVNQIRHPNIVDVFAFGQLEDGRSYLIMEWLPGMTLFHRLDQGPIPVHEAVEIIEQMADALEAAHEAGVIHRDVKPANVVLTQSRGRVLVKLLDFGVAKLLAQGDAPGCTRDGCVVGTPEYISPEQARSRNIDARADIYSLGVTVYEMLTAVLPFCADNPVDTMRLHLTQPAPRVREVAPQVPRELDSLVARMMDKNPEKRPTLIEVREVCTRLKVTHLPVGRGRAPRRVVFVGALVSAAALSAGLLASGLRAPEMIGTPMGVVAGRLASMADARAGARAVARMEGRAGARTQAALPTSAAEADRKSADADPGAALTRARSHTRRARQVDRDALLDPFAAPRLAARKPGGP